MAILVVSLTLFVAVIVATFLIAFKKVAPAASVNGVGVTHLDADDQAVSNKIPVQAWHRPPPTCVQFGPSLLGGGGGRGDNDGPMFESNAGSAADPDTPATAGANVGSNARLGTPEKEQHMRGPSTAQSALTAQASLFPGVVVERRLLLTAIDGPHATGANGIDPFVSNIVAYAPLISVDYTLIPDATFEELAWRLLAVDTGTRHSESIFVPCQLRPVQRGDAADDANDDDGAALRHDSKNDELAMTFLLAALGISLAAKAVFTDNPTGDGLVLSDEWQEWDSADTRHGIANLPCTDEGHCPDTVIQQFSTTNTVDVLVIGGHSSQDRHYHPHGTAYRSSIERPVVVIMWQPNSKQWHSAVPVRYSKINPGVDVDMHGGTLNEVVPLPPPTSGGSMRAVKRCLQESWYRVINKAVHDAGHHVPNFHMPMNVGDFRDSGDDHTGIARASARTAAETAPDGVSDDDDADLQAAITASLLVCNHNAAGVKLRLGAPLGAYAAGTPGHGHGHGYKRHANLCHLISALVMARQIPSVVRAASDGQSDACVLLTTLFTHECWTHDSSALERLAQVLGIDAKVQCDVGETLTALLEAVKDATGRSDHEHDAYDSTTCSRCGDMVTRERKEPVLHVLPFADGLQHAVDVATGHCMPPFADGTSEHNCPDAHCPSHIAGAGVDTGAVTTGADTDGGGSANDGDADGDSTGAGVRIKATHRSGVLKTQSTLLLRVLRNHDGKKQRGGADAGDYDAAVQTTCLGEIVDHTIVALCCHTGTSTQHGHYVTIVKNLLTGSWYDDFGSLFVIAAVYVL